MGLSVLLPVLLSVGLTLVIVLIIRNFDKKNSSFDNACKKIQKYSSITSSNLEKKCSEYIEKVDNKCGELDFHLAKGEGLIGALKRSLDNFGAELESIGKVKTEVNEYSGKLKSLGEQIEYLEDVLNKVHVSEEYLRNISSDLGKFQKNVAAAKCDLDNLNTRFDRLDNAYKKQNEDSLEKIKTKVIDNFEAESRNIIDNLNNYKDSLDESYTEINERLQEEKKRLSEYVADIIEKSDETRSSFEAKINEFSMSISRDLKLLYEEHQDKLISFGKSFEDIENRIVTIIQEEGAKKIQDLNTYFNSSWEYTEDKLQQHRDGVIQSIEKHYTEGRIDAQKMLQELRSVETRVSEKMLELSDFDSKIQQKSEQFESYLEESVKDKIKMLHDDLREIEDDVELMETSILTSLREKYEKFDSKVVEELNKIGSHMGKKVDSKMRELSGMENKISELKDAMAFIENNVMKTAGKLNAMSLDLKNSLYQKIKTLSADVDGRIKNMNATYEDDRKALIKTMENSLETLDCESREKVYNLRNRMQEIYSGVKSRLNNAENEIQRKTETIKRKFDQKIELIDAQIKQKEHKANTLIIEKLSGYFRNADEKSKEFENSLQEYHNDIFLLKDKFRKKCEDLTSWFAEKVKVFAGENDIAGKKYREEIKLLEADNFSLREKMLTENTQCIQSLNEQIKRIEDKLPAINEKVRLNSENLSKITEEQVLAMRKNIQTEVALIKQKMSEQSAAMDEKLVQKMRDVNEVINVIQNMISQYNSKLSDFDSQKTIIIENLENEVNELKAFYKEKGEEFVKTSEKHAETVKESIHILREKADSITEDLNLTVDSKILQSKNDFERIYLGIKESGKKELEDLIAAKATFMEELENRIAVLSNNSKSSLIKILKVAQKNINEIRDNADKSISDRCRELEEGAISSLEIYRGDLESLKSSLKEFGSHVGPQVLERI
ncbi:MAG: hypothetical protein J1G30_05505, partial [Spirochaetales bacterium]|nr:hypothetical protein [Spirochaetales bacterium]